MCVCVCVCVWGGGGGASIQRPYKFKWCLQQQQFLHLLHKLVKFGCHVRILNLRMFSKNMHRVISPEPEGEKCRTLTWQSCINSLSSRGFTYLLDHSGQDQFLSYIHVTPASDVAKTNKQKCTVGETHTNTEPIWWETILLLPIWMKKSHSNFRWLENQPLCLTKNKIRKTHSYFHSSWNPPPPPPLLFPSTE